MYKFFVLFCLIFLFPFAGSAHTLESDQTIGAVMHITPDDNPIVGQPATLVFTMSDKANLFNAQECVCTLIVKKGETELVTLDLNSTSLDKLETTYTFPESGMYSLSLKGLYKYDVTFETFELEFDLNVDRTEATAGTGFKTFLLTHGIHIILFGGAFVVVFAIHFRDLYRKRKQARASVQDHQ